MIIGILTSGFFVTPIYNSIHKTSRCSGLITREDNYKEIKK